MRMLPRGRGAGMSSGGTATPRNLYKPSTGTASRIGISLLAGSTKARSDTSRKTFPIQVDHLPHNPADVSEPSGLNICRTSTNNPASRKICLVWSIITSIEASRSPANGAHPCKVGKWPRLPGVLTATNVSSAEKVARLKPNISVCASCRLPTLSRDWKAGPSEAASTAGQHQAPIMAGMPKAAMHPEPQMEATSARPPSFCSSWPKSGSSHIPSCQLPCATSLELELELANRSLAAVIAQHQVTEHLS